LARRTPHREEDTIITGLTQEWRTGTGLLITVRTWGALEFWDYFPTPLTWRSFRVGESDYETGPDELTCPCGESIPWDASNLGSAVALAEEHIAEKHSDVRQPHNHPLPWEECRACVGWCEACAAPHEDQDGTTDNA
jgi:hypothetical protein